MPVCEDGWWGQGNRGSRLEKAHFQRARPATFSTLAGRVETERSRSTNCNQPPSFEPPSAPVGSVTHVTAARIGLLIYIK